MSFIKKIREFDASLPMLISLAIICALFLLKTWNPDHYEISDEQQLQLPNSQQQTPQIPHYPGWLSLAAQENDSLSILFNRAGLSQITLKAMLENNPYQRQLKKIKLGQVYYFKIENEEFKELLFFIDKKHFLKITQSNHQFSVKYETGTLENYLKSPSIEPAKTTPPQVQPTGWLTMHPHRGDTLRHIFFRAGLSSKTLYAVLNHNSHKRELARINPKLTIYLKIENHQLQEMIFPINPNKYLVIRPEGHGYQTLVKIGKPSIPQTSPRQVVDQPIEKPQQNQVQTPELKPAIVPTTSTKEQWVNIHPVRGDTLGRIFNRAGLGQKDLQNILYKNPYARQLSRINLNDEIRFKIQNHQLLEMVYSLDALRYLSITKVGPIYKTKVVNRPMVEKREYISTPVRGSLYQTARVAGIPQRIIDQVTQIFFWQVQLSREIRAGDRLNIAYQTYYVNGKKVKIGDVLAVSYKHANGVKYEAIRHKLRNGQITYYRPNGTSLKKAFSRYPIRFSHISSNFGSSRKHPILHYRRPHKGIDLAAPIGTPIYAIGDGRVSFIGRQNGYGNMIKINHAFSYTTVYAHMLRFQKGLRNGSYVQKGQIIGFVGQSGLATGPHCHYELHLNHIPRNPASVALPMAQPIPRHESYAFNRFTREIMAQLNLFEATKLARR
jgi:murein DD-endopeptidase MepM/ murein hydrolase activator NlpD/lambda repressor-like predicted transcriptional regulator